MTDILISSTTVARYLLRDDQIKPLAKTVIEWWLESAGNGDSKSKLIYSEYIKEEVIVNAVPLEKVWNAILESDHVWFFSHFEEESASLYWKLLGMAQKSNIRDRIFFNMAEKGPALQSLHHYCKQAQALMGQLEAYNNLRFFFFEDINEMIKSRQISSQQKTKALQYTKSELNRAVNYKPVIAALKKLGVRRPLSDEETAILDAFAARSPEHQALVAKIGNLYPRQIPLLSLTQRSSKVWLQKKLNYFSYLALTSLPYCVKKIRNSTRRLLHFLFRFTYNAPNFF